LKRACEFVVDYNLHHHHHHHHSVPAISYLLVYVSCVTQMTVTWVWPTSTVHLVGSFILGHLIQ